MTLYGTCVMLPCVREWVAHNVPWLTVIPLLQLNSPTPSGFHTVPNVQPLVSWLSSVLHDMWYVCVCAGGSRTWYDMGEGIGGVEEAEDNRGRLLHQHRGGVLLDCIVVATVDCVPLSSLPFCYCAFLFFK